LLNAEGCKQNAKNQTQPAFAGRKVAGKIPAKEHEKKKAKAESEDG
jgi:hypothetical protein